MTHENIRLRVCSQKIEDIFPKKKQVQATSEII